MHGAQTARDMHSRVGNVSPDAIERFPVSRLSGEGSHVGHRGIEVRRANRMSHSFLLLDHRRVLLRVGRRHHPFTVRYIRHAADLEELASHVEIKLLAGDSVQLDKGQLHFLMSGSLTNRLAVVVIWVAFKDDLINMLGTLLDDVQ